jgi:ferredoxin
MADKELKWPENVAGKFYVDQSCIATKYCIAVAPENFAMTDSGHSYVKRQPGTPEQEEQCAEAVRGCPVFAIGDDDN